MSVEEHNLNIPKHIAIIMDGNGRWAKQHNKTRIEGHKKGATQINKVMEVARKFGVEYITLYAFSSENWNRPKAEVSALMHLLEASIKTNFKNFVKNEIHFETIGDISALPTYCRNAIEKLKNATCTFKKQTLILALNYGSHDEITRVVKGIVNDVNNKGLSEKDICWEYIQNRLDTAQFPNPDLVIRTSGEMRLSNYLMLQSAYSELYFTEVLWPDFNNEELCKAVYEYQQRQRRYGLTGEQVTKDEKPE